MVKYKNAKINSDLTKLKFKQTERAVHDLVVIVPSGYTEEEVEEELNDTEDEFKDHQEE